VRVDVRDIPTRVSTGGYILHAGWEKWHGGDAQATGVHGMAAGAFPFLAKVPPRTFLKTLAAAEMGLGVALLAPVVPNPLAGLGLTGFAGGLVAMYLRTPTLHKPGSVWPTPTGTGVSKDVWMLGIGLSLLAGSGRKDD
jgi:uncharacterized membrane protein YphA (DoxX/SURF4 family)